MRDFPRLFPLPHERSTMSLPPRPTDTLMISLARSQKDRLPGEGATLFIPGDGGVDRILNDYDRTITEAQLLALRFAEELLRVEGDHQDASAADILHTVVEELRVYRDTRFPVTAWGPNPPRIEGQS